MTSKESPLKYRFRASETHVIADLAGSIDATNIGRARDLVQLLLSQGYLFILLNLKDVEYVDSSGLGFFTGTMKLLKDRGGELVLYHFHPYVRRIFSLIQLDFFITTRESETEAVAHLKLGREKVIARWQAVTRVNTGHADAHFHLAVALKEEGRFEEAQAEIEVALAINPGYVDALKLAGDIRYKKGEYPAAIEWYEAALRLSPRNPKILVVLGSLYRDRDKVLESIDLFNEILQEHPDWADVRNGLGVAYLLAGEPAMAREHLELALQINPNYTDARLNYLRVLKQLGESKAFEEECRLVKPGLVRPDQKRIFKQISEANA